MKILCLTLALVALSSMRSRGETESSWKGSSEITFAGTSTLHNWSGKVTARPFIAKVTVNAKGEPTHLTSKVEVTASKMDTADSDRDAKMRESMHVKEFPLITAEMDCAFNQIAVRGATPSELPFQLTLLGKRRAVIGQISHWALKEGVATFDLDFSLSLKACGIEVPTMMWVIKVGDTIRVHAEVKLARAGGSP